MLFLGYVWSVFDMWQVVVGLKLLKVINKLVGAKFKRTRFICECNDCDKIVSYNYCKDWINDYNSIDYFKTNCFQQKLYRV